MQFSRIRSFYIILGCIYLFGVGGFVTNALSATLWVSPTGNNVSGTGTKANPYKTISFAINLVSQSDTVRVVEGIYIENLSILNKPDFVLQGETTLNKPQIIGVSNAPTINIDPGLLNSTRAMRIENFIITHSSGIDGNGIRAFNSSFTLANCEIIDNETNNQGAGIWISSDKAGIKPLLENNIITQNTGGTGTGIYCENTAIEIIQNDISENDALANNGGAIALINSFDVTIKQNSFYNNSADSGGAVFINTLNGLSVNSFFEGNVLYENAAASDGGAVYLKGSTVVWKFASNTFAENSAANDGGAAFVEASATIFFRENNIITRNSAGNNGGAIAFVNVPSAINVWSNTITGNKAFNNGGGLYFDNVNTVSVGGAANLSNNIFHNQDKNQLNNITSSTSIISLNLSRNYWGFADQSQILQQFTIPNINTSWEIFNSAPTDVKIKLFMPQKNIWFADGKIAFGLGQFVPQGDSTLTVRTHPDTSFSINGIQQYLPKMYNFDWSGVTMPVADAKISLFLDKSELAALDNPFPQSLQLLELQDTTWTVAATTVNTDGSEISADLPSFAVTRYTIGLDLSSLFLVEPKPNKADVNKDKPFRIKFQVEMDETTLIEENIGVHGSFSGDLNFTSFFDVSGNSLYLNVPDALQAGETVTVTLTDSVKTKSNTSLDPGYQWRFQISAFRGSAQFQQVGIPQSRSGDNLYVFNDFNKDQLPELIELSGQTLTVFSNSGGSYIVENTQDIGSDFSQIKLADLNNDGLNEIIVFNNTDILAYSYDTAGGFAPAFSKNLTNNGTLMDAVIADFNNDLVQDMAVLVDQSDFSQINCYYGDMSSGQYDFGLIAPVVLNGPADQFADTDWDNDGLFDLIASNGTDGSNIARIINQKTSFTSFFNTLPEISSQAIVTTANVWEDGTFPNSDEIIIAGTGGGLNLLKFFNLDENGFLVEAYRREFSSAIIALTAADFNSDGYNDLAVGFANNDISFLLSNNGILEDISTISSPVIPQNLQSVDYDSDGDLDLLASEQVTGSSSWVIFENVSRAPKTWWVDSKASTGDGSFGSPFTFINQAIEKSFAGDSILVAEGIFTENLKIKHDLYLASQDTSQVVLMRDSQDLFSNIVMQVSGTQLFEAHHITFTDDALQAGTQAFYAENNDSLVLDNIHIRQFDKAAQFENSRGTLNAVFIEENDKGMLFTGSNMALTNVGLERNKEFGLAADNSTLSVLSSGFLENGSNASSNSAGLLVTNGSVVSLAHVDFSCNGNANIQLDNASLDMSFTLVGEALSNGLSTDGIGVVARNNSVLNVENSVIVDNFKIGATINNSQATILNSLIANNDSLFDQNGGGLFVNNSTVDVRNSILLSNNTGLNVQSSTMAIHFNDFFGNKTAINGASPGNGNLAVDPLMVFQSNPLGADGKVDGFYDLKLAPGSALIDKGDPTINNGDTQSRSDIGLYGNLALPEALSSVPEVAVSLADSSVALSWQQPLTEEAGLFSGTVIFRDTLALFEPDTSNIYKFIPAGNSTFTDSDLGFGKEFYYRFAFIDSNGAANAYTSALQGRIDFKEINASISDFSVQVGQGDSLSRPITISNVGTVPVTVVADENLPGWLRVFPKKRLLQRGESAAFLLGFDATGLKNDSLYTTSLKFVTEEDATIASIVGVQMLVSYRDLLAPKTTLFRLYPDTIRQASLSFSFGANDTINSTIGTPLNLMRYIYRFSKIMDGQPTVLESDTTITQRLDFYPLENGKYLFQVAALDTAGNGAIGLNSKSVSVDVSSGTLDIFDDFWQMVTLPRQIIGSGIQIKANSLKALSNWQDGRYVTASPDSVLPGRAYWAFTTKKIEVDLNSYQQITAEKDFSVDLQKGWNMIGNPWSWNIDLEKSIFTTESGVSFNYDEAVKDSLVNPSTFYWKASRFTRQYKNEESGMLKANRGYWLLVSQPLSVRFNPQPLVLFEDTSLPKSTRAIAVNEQDALIRLKVKQGHSEDNDNYFGLCLNKSDYPYFYQGALEPPAISDNIRLFSRRGGQQYTTNLVAFNTIKSEQVWDLVIEGNTLKEESIVSWENLNGGAQTYFFLYHLESGEWFNINERDSFKIENSKEKNHFKLYATANENFKPEILPTKFALSQNYPNPFNPSTKIKLSIPFFADNVDVNLDIYDVLGRKVKNLLNRKVKSGDLEITWTGKNDLGKQVASGIYFYRLSAGKFVKSKKMILLR